MIPSSESASSPANVRVIDHPGNVVITEPRLVVAHLAPTGMGTPPV